MKSVFTLASSYFALEAPLDRPTAFLVLSLSNDHNLLLRKKLFCKMSVFDHSEKFIIIIIIKSKSQLGNDIALLKLSRKPSFLLNEKNPILPLCEHDYDDYQLAVCGMGAVNRTTWEDAVVLQELKVDSLSQEECPSS